MAACWRHMPWGQLKLSGANNPIQRENADEAAQIIQPLGTTETE